MSKNRIKAGILATAIIGCLTIGGISAYFTDTDTATNTFTIGKVEIDLMEPNWEPPTDITPNQEMKKDPQVENTGLNDAYIFVEVTVPYKNVVTANHDGTVNPKVYTELFAYDLKEGWIELTAEKEVSESEGIVKHVYAYAATDEMTVVKKGEVTKSVFEYVKFVNLVESDELAGTTLDVIVNAYGIQTKNLNDGKDSLDGNNDDGKISPEEVWAVISNQNQASAT